MGDGGVRLHVHGYEQRRWQHLDTCQFRTIIEASVPRVLDPADGKTQMVKVPWAGPRSGWTLMFEHLVFRILLACATLNYFTHSITNALTEGLNSRIQLLKASARGFRNFDNYRIRILFFLGGLDMLPALSQSTETNEEPKVAGDPLRRNKPLYSAP
jgi:transposase